MSVVIVGGNECMVRRYEDLCREYSCKAKVFAKPDRGMQNFGNPDLLVLFTGTMSHKMLSIAMGQAKKKNIPVAHSATSSVSALKIYSISTRKGRNKMSEDLVISQCSPTMAGLKTGNLFTCPMEDKKTLNESIRRMNMKLVPRGCACSQ